jgi:2-polyprenyl-3-methyl-5-hydroxy-6-metoxy-1,4-benzoquinol methylase
MRDATSWSVHTDRDLASPMSTAKGCRACGSPLALSMIDLGVMPLANAYIDPMALESLEQRYPLHVRVCESCLLTQLDHDVEPALLFSNYAYFSSWSTSWVEHARQFVATASERLALSAGSRVVEIASNDGYLLRHFDRSSVDVLGVEPAANVAERARAAGVPTDVAFFGAQYAHDHVTRRGPVDLVIANNVMAHVPNLTDFIAGIAMMLGDSGVASIEVPHLLELVDRLAFDTIYHEHYSYFSILAIAPLLARFDLELFDVEPLATHGGSVRLWISRVGKRPWEGRRRVDHVVQRELTAGLDVFGTYRSFGERVNDLCREFVDHVRNATRAGVRYVGYGAAAKGNTFLNYCAITTDDLSYVADISPEKQGRLLPGTHIPVVPPERLTTDPADVVVILAWNLRDEISAQLEPHRRGGTRLAVAIPRLEIF